MEPSDGVAHGAAFLLFLFIVLWAASGPVAAFPHHSEPCIEDGGVALCSAPIIGEQEFRMCSEGASFLSRFAAECRVFMDGVWVTGRPSGPTCDDYTYPILDEAELKPRAEEFGRQYM